MGKILRCLVVLLFMCSNVMAITVDWETITGNRYSSPYSWNYSYDIGLFDDVLMVDLDIKMVGDVDSSVLNKWESGIEDVWSTNRFDVPITFNVDWVDTDYDQYVYTVEGSGRSTMHKWYEDDDGRLAAHEAGHMFGLYDEYWGGATDPETGLAGTGGLMHTLSGLTLDHYYKDFLGWYDGIDFSDNGSRDFPSNGSNPVPEPTTMLLMGIGLLLTGSLGRKRFK
jgi:hypothetical protein